MSLVIHVPKPETPQRRAQSFEAGGRPWQRVAGGWVSDLVSLRKFITLCPFCDPKFNPKKNGYESWRRDMLVVARCDGCNTLDPRCKAWLHQSYHQEVGDWRRHPRRGRWASTGRR